GRRGPPRRGDARQDGCARHARHRPRQPPLPAHARPEARPLAGHADAIEHRQVNPLRVAFAVARKDLMSEWRTRELVPALAQFVVLALLIGNFGFQVDPRNANTIAPGILWLALVFAGLGGFRPPFARGGGQAPSPRRLVDPH